jgi:hypothetical protein
MLSVLSLRVTEMSISNILMHCWSLLQQLPDGQLVQRVGRIDGQGNGSAASSHAGP